MLQIPFFFPQVLSNFNMTVHYVDCSKDPDKMVEQKRGKILM